MPILQGLHLSDILAFDDDDDNNEQNNIEISRMNKGRKNKDYTMGNSEKLQVYRPYNNTWWHFQQLN